MVCADCRLLGLLNCLVVWFILCGLVAVAGVLDCCVLSIAVMLVCVLRSVGRVTWRSLLCLSFIVSLVCGLIWLFIAVWCCFAFVVCFCMLSLLFGCGLVGCVTYVACCSVLVCWFAL